VCQHAAWIRRYKLSLIDLIVFGHVCLGSTCWRYNLGISGLTRKSGGKVTLGWAHESETAVGYLRLQENNKQCLADRHEQRRCAQ